MKALKQLCSRQLYKSKNICINTTKDESESEAPNSKTGKPT